MSFAVSQYPGRWSAVCLLIGLPTVSISVWNAPMSLPLSLLSGCLTALTLGHLVPLWAIWLMRRRAQLHYGNAPTAKRDEYPTSDALGVVERLVIYWGCVLGVALPVIGGWIALKTLSKWGAWGEGQPDADGKGRATYYLFLVGTALSVSGAVAAAIFALWLTNPDSVPELFTFRFLAKE